MQSGLKAAVAAVLMTARAFASLPAAAASSSQPQGQPSTMSADAPVDDGFCDIYGTGYHRVPGTDTCIKVGGHVQMTVGAQGGSN